MLVEWPLHSLARAALERTHKRLPGPANSVVTPSRLPSSIIDSLDFAPPNGLSLRLNQTSRHTPLDRITTTFSDSLHQILTEFLYRRSLTLGKAGWMDGWDRRVRRRHDRSVVRLLEDAQNRSIQATFGYDRA